MLLLWLGLWLPLSAEEFLLEINGHNVRVLNNGAIFNCGSAIDGILDLECGTVKLIELEVLVEPQYCNCPFDLIFDFTLAPMEYTLHLWRQEWWQDEPLLIWVEEFVVEESGFLTDVRVQQSGCGGWGPTSVPEGESALGTWTFLRQLY
jgi:hypothetical protein